MNKMKPTTSIKRFRAGTCALLLGIACASSASAATSYFDTVNETGSASDFNSVPIAYSNPTATGPLPIETVQIANDNGFLYVGITFTSAVNGDSLSDTGQLTMALDNDANTATGFNTFSAGVVGSEVGFGFDYPFQQTSGNYNTGVDGITAYGGVFSSTLNYTPYNQSTTFEEFSLSLADTYTVGGTTYAVLPNSSFALAFYDSNGTADSDFTGALDYSLAVPEPGTLSLLFSGLVVALVLAYRRLGSAI